MEALYLEATDDTPKVVLDPSSGTYQFIGNSYPENSTKFYTQVLDWFRDFAEQKRDEDLVFDFVFDYFNTSSAKYILEIIRQIQVLQNAGNECLVRWHYYEDDTDMLESGEDYEMTVEVPFELIERPEED